MGKPIKTTSTTLQGIKTVQDWRLISHAKLIDFFSPPTNGTFNHLKYVVRVKAGDLLLDVDCVPLYKWATLLEKTYGKNAEVEVSIPGKYVDGGWGARPVAPEDLIEFRCQGSIIRLARQPNVLLDDEPIELSESNGVMHLSTVVDMNEFKAQKDKLARIRKATAAQERVNKVAAVLKRAKEALANHASRIAHAKDVVEGSSLGEALSVARQALIARRERRQLDKLLDTEIEWTEPESDESLSWSEQRKKRDRDRVTTYVAAMNEQMDRIAAAAAALPIADKDQWEATFDRLKDNIDHMSRCSYKSGGWDKRQEQRANSLRSLRWLIAAAHSADIEARMGKAVEQRILGFTGSEALYHVARRFLKTASVQQVEYDNAVAVAEAEYEAANQVLTEARDAIENPPAETSVVTPAPVSSPSRKTATLARPRTKAPVGPKVRIGNLNLSIEKVAGYVEKYDSGDLTGWVPSMVSWMKKNVEECRAAVKKTEAKAA